MECWLQYFKFALAAQYVAGLLIALSSMLHLELPPINILSKIDLLEKFPSKPAFDREFYSEIPDLSSLTELLDEDIFTSKYEKMNERICSVIEDYLLVSFDLLNIFDKSSLLSVMRATDKALGYFPSNPEEILIDVLLDEEPEEESDENLKVWLAVRQNNFIYFVDTQERSLFPIL